MKKKYMHKLLPKLFHILNYDTFHGKIFSFLVSLFQMIKIFICRPSLKWFSLFKLVFIVKPFYSQLSAQRLLNLYRLGEEVNALGLKGDVVECGVWNGGSAAMIARGLDMHKSLTSRNIWLFDSFEGLPQPTERDDKQNNKYYFEGVCTGNEKNVDMIFNKMNISKERVKIVKGWIKDTFLNTKIEEISLLHVDMDWFDSIELVLEHFYENVVKGGFVVIDDYYTLQGCHDAVNSFLKRKNLQDSVDIIKVDWNGVYFCKP